jgi:hypothetical protein
MISDILSDAHAHIQSYLGDPIYAEIYSGELRAEIERVMAAMESLRQKLDRPPVQAEQQRTSG